MIQKPIGVFGGTFDPVHFGHLRPALELFETLQLDHVRMIPCGLPAHRASPHVDAQRRLTMLKLALFDEPHLIPDEREVRRSGPSYMVDTLLSLREEFGQRPLCLLLGTDSFSSLPSWHRWRELFDLAHIVVAQRAGRGRKAWEAPLREQLQRRLVRRAVELAAQPAGLVIFQPVTQLEISATRIRELIARGRSVRYLMPETVRGYIETEGLYRQNR